MNLGPPANDPSPIGRWDGTEFVHCQWLVAATTILRKNPFCQADNFFPEAFLVHQLGSNPQPKELCADIGREHFMLI
jgi:hypothetical protein